MAGHRDLRDDLAIETSRPTSRPPFPAPFIRSRDDRVITGTAGGIARRLGATPGVVRTCFLVLTVAAGAGAALYLLAVACSADEPEDPARRRSADPTIDARHDLGVAAITGGLLFVLRDLGIWLGDQVIAPLALAVIGSAVILRRDDQSVDGRRRGSNDAGSRWNQSPFSTLLGARPSRLRLVLGVALVVAGVMIFLAANEALVLARTAVVAMLATAAGVTLILGPWVSRLARDVMEERNRRIRSDERAEVGAHLHDSVLHTLALIQRSQDSGEMVSLARRQERELRAWLQDRSSTEAEQLAAAVEAMSTRVEGHHRVIVDAVVVGDCAMDERVEALLMATQEATVNAARHSGVDHVSVYVEVEPEMITAYVRDQGHGFDVATIPDDRRGLRESIEGRMRRHGGVATIRSSVGSDDGTEVELRLPLQSR